MGVRQWICGHRVAAFLLLTFGWSWAIWTPAVLAFRNNGGTITAPLMLLALVGAYGPSLAAVAVTWCESGRAGVRRLLGSLVQWRVGPAWYAAVLLISPAALFAALLIAGRVGELHADRLGAQAMMIPIVILTALPFGPLAEELGWRGYLLPRVQEGRSALASAILVGLVWAVWHLPLWWVPGAALPTWTEVGLVPVAEWTLNTVALSVLFTWVYNNTRGSILVAVLFHLMTNATGRIVLPLYAGLPDAEFARIDGIRGLVHVALAIAVVAVFGPRLLRREDRA